MFLLAIVLWTTFFGSALAHGSAILADFAARERRIESALSTIEERLQSVAQSIEKLAGRPGGHFEQGALEWNARRLDAFESRMERLEAAVTSEVRRIEANWTLLAYKHDFARDQVLRKIDAVYERLHNRLSRLESQVDTSQRNMTEQIGHHAGRLARVQEAAHLRHIETYDGLKSLINTKFDSFAQYFDSNLEKKVQSNLRQLQDNIEGIRREIQPNRAMTTDNCGFENEDTEARQLQAQGNNLELLLNATRYEMQNSLRVILVQVGRLQSKSSERNQDNDWGFDGSRADVHNKLDTLIEQQSAFLESCYRIQSDEPQLESKISEILEKIIDVFQKESVAGIKDIQNLEHVVRNQDSAARRSMYTLSHNLGVLTQKALEYRDEIKQQVVLVRSDLEQLSRKFNESLLSLPLARLHHDFANWSATSREVLEQLKETCSEMIDKRFAGLREQVQKLEVDLVDKLSSRVEDILQCARIENGSRTDQNAGDNVDSSLDAIIREIFGQAPRNNSSMAASNTDDPIIFEESGEFNCSEGNLDLRSEDNCLSTDKTNETESSSMDLKAMHIDRRVANANALPHTELEQGEATIKDTHHSTDFISLSEQ